MTGKPPKNKMEKKKKSYRNYTKGKGKTNNVNNKCQKKVENKKNRKR